MDTNKLDESISSNESTAAAEDSVASVKDTMSTHASTPKDTNDSSTLASTPKDANDGSTIASTPKDLAGSSTNALSSNVTPEDAALDRMKNYEGFVGNPVHKTEVIKWERNADEKGRVLYDTRINGPLNLVAVFQIMSYKFYVGPMGNYSGNYSLNSARYKFVGCAPNAEPYSEVYKQTIHLLKYYEKKASDRPSAHLFEPEGGKGLPSINFSYPVFHLRDKALRNQEVRYFDDTDNLEIEEDPDALLQLSEYKLSQVQTKAYSQIASKYYMQPLPVYKDGQFVYPTEVEDALRGTVVQVQFNLVNHFIEKERTQSIIARVVDICILHKLPGSPFKRCNVLEGPLTPEKQGSPSKKRRE